MPGYTEDEGKTIVRMGKQEMERLGISSGEVVKVSGNRTTAALCLVDDAKYQNSNELKIIYLNQPERVYPIARLANVVYQNARIIHGMGSLVKIDKMVSKVMEASKVILSTTKEAKTVYGNDYEKKIDFTKYLENIVSKGDTMNFVIESEKRKSFFSVILDVEPSNNQDTVWKI